MIQLRKANLWVDDEAIVLSSIEGQLQANFSNNGYPAKNLFSLIGTVKF